MAAARVKSNVIDKPKPKAKNQNVLGEDALMWAIGFTPIELNANQDEVLSDYQREKFRIERQNNLLVIIPCVLIAIAVLGLRQIWVSSVNNIILLIPIFLCGLVGLAAIVNVYNYHRDLIENRAKVVHGRLSLDILDKSHYTYAIKIQDQRWLVEKDVFLAFKNGDPYAVYYAPHSKTILSAEWLRED